MRREAAALPQVFVSRLNPPSPPPAKPALHRLRLPDTPAHLLPDPHWQDELVLGFARLQASLMARRASGAHAARGVPARGEAKQWEQIIMGHAETKPTLRFFLALDHTVAVEALRACDSVLAARGFANKDALSKFTPWTTETVLRWTSDVLLFENTLWFLFQLLAILSP